MQGFQALIHTLQRPLIAALLFYGLSAAANAETQSMAAKSSASEVAQTDAETAREARLQEGMRLIAAHKAEEAIRDVFDKLIAEYEAAYAGSKRRIFCSRTTPETLFYLSSAAVDKQDAIVLGPTWAYAYFMKGYALQELGRTTEGREFVRLALKLSPSNPQFLAELGSSYVFQKNWATMLETYVRAETATAIGSPDDLKTVELTRALRGQGFALIEMGRFKEAEAKYRECLKLDPNDEKAKNELDYISHQQQNSA